MRFRLGATLILTIGCLQAGAQAVSTEIRQEHGTVTLQVTVDRDGYPHEVKVTQSVSQRADKTAIQEVRKWRFDPARKNGEPVPVKIEVQVDVACAAPDRECKIANDGAAQGSEPKKLSLSSVPIEPVDRAGKGSFPPKAISSQGPTLTDEERAWIKQLGTHATVVMQVMVDSTGTPTNVRLVRGVSGDLDRKTIAALKTWKFEPAMKDGKPVSMQINVELDLRMF